MRPWIAYTLLRVGLFAVFFAVLFVLGLQWWLAAILAAALGFCVAYIFFRRLRERVALDLAAARANTDSRPDEVVEDTSGSDRG
jgi:membrane protein implicated in regulation of membrane protease activity